MDVPDAKLSRIRDQAFLDSTIPLALRLVGAIRQAFDLARKLDHRALGRWYDCFSGGLDRAPGSAPSGDGRHDT